jgi:gliding motility-associated-like protein
MYWGSSYQMHAGGGLLYSWTPVTGLDSATSPDPIAAPTETTLYTCTISDGTGCYTTRQVLVTILHDNNFFIPNTFSPNGDGRNDYLFLRGNNLYGIRFTVYDRWGEKVFETTNQQTGWDGTYKGKDLNPGVFTYIVTINFDDGTTVSKTGSVTLVR